MFPGTVIVNPLGPIVDLLHTSTEVAPVVPDVDVDWANPVAPVVIDGAFVAVVVWATVEL